MARRVVLGQQSDGSYGLRVSAPSFDALAATDDGDAVTFDSRWTDIMKLYVVGLVAGSGGWAASWPSLGYIPFVEIRQLLGDVVYDDYFSGQPSNPFGIPSQVSASGFSAPGANVSLTLLYIVYQVPAPSG